MHTYIHYITLHCIALHYTTYIHTYHHHRGIIPPPSHGGVGTRDTGPYMYIYIYMCVCVHIYVCVCVCVCMLCYVMYVCYICYVSYVCTYVRM